MEKWRGRSEEWLLLWSSGLRQEQKWERRIKEEDGCSLYIHFMNFRNDAYVPTTEVKRRLKTKGFGRQMGLVQERKFLQIKSTFQCAQEWHISRFQGKTHFFYKNDDYAPIQHEIVKQRVSGHCMAMSWTQRLLWII